MRQYGASEDEARRQLQQQVENGWKDINRECLEPRPASMPILMRVVNLSRVAHLIYSGGDGYTDPNRAKEWVKMLFVEPLMI